MKMNRYLLSSRKRLSTLVTIAAFCGFLTAFAGANPRQEPTQGSAQVTVENFGQVNDHIYRGGQPNGDNYRQLAATGIKTVVDLRGDSKPDSMALAEGAGLRYVNLPLDPREYPQPDAAQRFLEIVNDQSNWPVYVYCAGGRHRTGVMIGVYRITIDGWDIDRTYQEMKDYGFYTKFGYGCYRDYINDYYRNWQARRQTYLPADAITKNKMTRITKVTRIDTVTGALERPVKRIYKARPIFKKDR
jgi:protein tyrosine/serine phosphatase